MSKTRVKCNKCGKLHYCEEHHILPKKLFGEGETVKLCKNCHDEYHRYLGHEYLHQANKQPMIFYLTKWYHWYYVIALVCVLMLIFKL